MLRKGAHKRLQTNLLRSLGLLVVASALILSLQATAGDSDKALAKQAPHLAELIVLEQTVNDKVEDTSTFSTIRGSKIPSVYRPENQKVFPLYAVEIPEADLEIYSNADVHTPLIRARAQSKRRFYIHPHSLKYFEKYMPVENARTPLNAVATSSYRSLIAWGKNQSPIGIKVGLDAQIGGISRMLNRSQVETSAAVSSWIHSIDRKQWAERGALFLDEPLNVIHTESNQGFSIREYPRPRAGHKLVPFFSFISTDSQGEAEIINAVKNSSLDAKTWVTDNILKPHIKNFVALLHEEGVILQPHDQNFLLELGKNNQPTGRIYYRDLGGFSFDAGFRIKAKKDFSFLPKSLSARSLLSQKATEAYENIYTYMFRASFFSTQSVLSTEFPEVTQKWMNETSRELLLEENKRYYKTGSPKSITELRNAWNDTSIPANKAIKNCARELSALLGESK